jgi:hypothetical protein
LPVIVLSPVLKWRKGMSQPRTRWLRWRVGIGLVKRTHGRAYRYACRKQREFEQELLEIGKTVLDDLTGILILSG